MRKITFNHLKYECQYCGAEIGNLNKEGGFAFTVICFCNDCKGENIFFQPSSQVSNAALAIIRKEGLVKQ